MKNIFNGIEYMPRLVVLFIALSLAAVTTFATFAQSNVDTYINGGVTVKNVTSGSTTYADSTNAANKDIVRFKVQYYNTELANSGKVAKNVTVVVDFPNDLASTQNVAATIKGDNTNTIYDSATVYLPTDTSNLVYIPGSAKWQRNVGDRQNIDYQFVDLNDNVITEGKPIVLGDIQPSYEFEGFVYFDATTKENKKPETPVYECTALTAVVNSSNKFSFLFTTTTKMSGDVSVNKYVYDFGTGEDKVNTDKAQITKVYQKPGTYNVGVEVVFNVGDVQKSDVCTTNVKITEEPKEPPVNPPAPELPNTGPAETALAGLFGTGALSYGAMSLRASRSALRRKMLGLDED